MASAGEIDREKAKQVAQQIMADVASALHSAMTFIGDRLGVFKAMKDAGPLTVEHLAARTGLNQRYLQEWLNSMAAAQYLEYNPAAQTYLLTPEYAYLTDLRHQRADGNWKVLRKAKANAALDKLATIVPVRAADRGLFR